MLCYARIRVGSQKGPDWDPLDVLDNRRNAVVAADEAILVKLVHTERVLLGVGPILDLLAAHLTARVDRVIPHSSAIDPDLGLIYPRPVLPSSAPTFLGGGVHSGNRRSEAFFNQSKFWLDNGAAAWYTRGVNQSRRI